MKTANRAFALLVAILLFSTPVLARAAELSAASDKAEVQAGDTVELIFTLRGDHMSIAEGSFSYDPNVLAFSEGEGGVSDGLISMASAAKGGADTLVARVQFSAVSAGKADVAVQIDRVLGYNGKEQGGGSASVSVTVTAAAETPAPRALDYAVEGVLAQGLDGEGALYIWRTLENVTVPSRYSETTLTYHGETVAAAKVEDSDAPTLLYLSNASGDAGGYYIYEEGTDTLYPYRTVTSVSKSYILLSPDAASPAPDGFSETTLMIGEREVPAWKAADAQGDVYLLYARNADGEKGYYYYNPQDESLQRYSVLPARPAAPTLPPLTNANPVSPGTEASPPTTEPAAGNGALNIFLLIAVIVLALCVAGLLFLRHTENARRRQRTAKRKAEIDAAYRREIGG